LVAAAVHEHFSTGSAGRGRFARRERIAFEARRCDLIIEVIDGRIHG